MDDGLRQRLEHMQSRQMNREQIEQARRDIWRAFQILKADLHLIGGAVESIDRAWAAEARRLQGIDTGAVYRSEGSL